MARDLIQTFPHQDQHAQYKATLTPKKAHTPYQCYPTKEIQRFQTKLIEKKKKSQRNKSTLAKSFLRAVFN